jgi:hypothetical protein
LSKSRIDVPGLLQVQQSGNLGGMPWENQHLGGLQVYTPPHGGRGFGNPTNTLHFGGGTGGGLTVSRDVEVVLGDDTREVLSRISNTKVVMLPTQLLPCQNINLRRSEYW